MKLKDILFQGTRLRAKEFGSTLPDNPTLDDFRNEAFRIAQLTKELQNSKPGGYFPRDVWSKLSKHIEDVETIAQKLKEG